MRRALPESASRGEAEEKERESRGKQTSQITIAPDYGPVQWADIFDEKLAPMLATDTDDRRHTLGKIKGEDDLRLQGSGPQVSLSSFGTELIPEKGSSNDTAK